MPHGKLSSVFSEIIFEPALEGDIDYDKSQPPLEPQEVDPPRGIANVEDRMNAINHLIEGLGFGTQLNLLSTSTEEIGRSSSCLLRIIQKHRQIVQARQELAARERQLETEHVHVSEVGASLLKKFQAIDRELCQHQLRERSESLLRPCASLHWSDVTARNVQEVEGTAQRRAGKTF